MVIIMKSPETTPRLSKYAITVLEKMQTGQRLFGNIGDYGRPFQLRPAIEDVPSAVAKELLQAGRIKSAAKKNDLAKGDLTEYEPA